MINKLIDFEWYIWTANKWANFVTKEATKQNFKKLQSKHPKAENIPVEIQKESSLPAYTITVAIKSLEETSSGPVCKELTRILNPLDEKRNFFLQDTYHFKVGMFPNIPVALSGRTKWKIDDIMGKYIFSEGRTSNRKVNFKTIDRDINALVWEEFCF